MGFVPSTKSRTLCPSTKPTPTWMNTCIGWKANTSVRTTLLDSKVAKHDASQYFINISITSTTISA